jgi:retinol dehydrogenase 12
MRVGVCGFSSWWWHGRLRWGGRTLVHGASSGKESRGQYIDDGRVHDDRVLAFVKGEEGQKAQKKIWKELGEKLDKIQPGIMQTI